MNDELHPASAEATGAPDEAARARFLALAQARPAHSCHLYGVIDAAIDDSLYPQIQAEPSFSDVRCLYDGEPAIRYATYAPYLLSISLESPLCARWLDGGWSGHWGIFIASLLPADKVKRHLKKLVQVTTPQGQKAWMRFYDPRVLPKLLSMADPAHAQEFFSSTVQAYLLPGSQPDQLLRITFDQPQWVDRLSRTDRAVIETLTIRQPLASTT